MQNILQIAAGQMGVQELTGEAHNPVIIKYAHESGFTEVNDDETAWCSIFINWCCEQAGLQRSHKMNARSWLYVGKTITNPYAGDIVVLWRESPSSWKGHVGIFLGYTKDRNKIFVLGGNQKNSVSVQAYDASQVLAFKRLTASKGLEVPEPVLTLGSRGSEVMKLQVILIDLGYDCGAVDGIFGLRTKENLSAFQTAENMKEQNGVYDENTKKKFQSIY